MTGAETFGWYRATSRLSIGIAHLWEQNAFRALGAYTLSPETSRLPSVNVSAGVQGIGTGNPGYSLTAERNLYLKEGNLNAFAGVGFRSNESHAHAVGGVKFTWANGVALGFQSDGHQNHPFATYGRESWIAGVYLVGFKSPAVMLGYRF